MNLLVNDCSNLYTNYITDLASSEVVGLDNSVLYNEPRELPTLFNGAVSYDAASNMRHIMKFTSELINKNKLRQSEIELSLVESKKLVNEEELVEDLSIINYTLSELAGLTEIDRYK